MSAATRRAFLKQIAGTTAAVTLGPQFISLAQTLPNVNGTVTPAAPVKKVGATLKINGTEHKLELDPRVSLLDLLREELRLTGSKKDAITASAARALSW